MFLSNLPRSVVEREDLGFNILFRFARARVDRTARRVRCSFLGTGLFAATAVFVDGIGSVLLCGETEESVRARLRMPARRNAHPADAPWPLGDGERTEAPQTAGVDRAGLEAAAERLFTEPKRGPRLRTRALLIVQDDRILLEALCPGHRKGDPAPRLVHGQERGRRPGRDPRGSRKAAAPGPGRTPE